MLAILVKEFAKARPNYCLGSAMCTGNMNCMSLRGGLKNPKLNGNNIKVPLHLNVNSIKNPMFVVVYIQF